MKKNSLAKINEIDTSGQYDTIESIENFRKHVIDEYSELNKKLDILLEKIYLREKNKL